MAKTDLTIKNINALFANINLHRRIRSTEDNANILLAPFVASVHFFITIMMIILINIRQRAIEIIDEEIIYV